MSATERTKLHLAIGQLSLEYEGDESFSKDDLVDLLGQLSDVHARSGSTPAPLQESSPDDSPAPKTQPNLSVDTIAARLHANSGPELVIAAIGKLTLVDGKQVIPRGDILSAMRNAVTYYKKAMASNLTGSLRRLVSAGRLNETSTGNYSLSASERLKVEGALDNSV